MLELKNRKIVKINGEDSENFLQGLITNDITKVNDNNSIYSLMLTPQGKFLFDFFILKFENAFFIDLEEARISEFLSKLKIYKLRSRVNFEDISQNYSVIWIQEIEEQGFMNIKQAPGLTLNYLNGKIYFDPRSLKMGIRGIIPKNNLINISPNANNQSYEYYRISQSIPEGDKDLIVNKSFPLEYGMENFNAIDYQKGCYVGQELVARTHYRGVIRKKIIKIQGSNLKTGEKILNNDKELGIICSVSNNIALALIRIEEFDNLENNAILISESNSLINYKNIG